MGIRARLLTFAVVVAVPLAVVGVIGLLGIWNVSRTQLNESLRQQAELAAIAFEGWVDAQQVPLTTLAATASAKTDTSSLRSDLHFLLQTRPHWIDVRVVLISGKTLVAEPLGEPPPPLALVDHLLKKTHDHSVWMATDRTRGGLQPVMAIAVPIRDGGAVIARIDGAAISGLFQNIQLNDRSVISVFDSQADILFRRQTTETPIDREVNRAPLFGALGNQSVAVVEMDSPYDGIRRIYGLARTGTTRSIVVVGVPSVTLYEPARRRLLLYLYFSLLAFASAVLAAFLIERSIRRPIHQLRQATQAFGNADLNARASETAPGEIGQLGAAFNQMAGQIAEREEKLKELDRLKSEFVSSVSHELRTPLTTIKTLTHVLLRDRHDTARSREHLETIAAECNREIELVNNLLDLSRIQSGEYQLRLTRVDPAEVLSNAQKIEQHAAAARGQTLSCELPRDPAAVKAETTTLRRILCTLIENAIKFTPDGGRITIGARNDFESVALYVDDTGSGISARDLPHVFEKFYRGANGDSADSVQQPGVGLGLYIVRGLVEQLGGRIEVESVVGQGSRFTIYLPKWSEPAQIEPEEVEHVEAFTGN